MTSDRWDWTPRPRATPWLLARGAEINDRLLAAAKAFRARLAELDNDEGEPTELTTAASVPPGNPDSLP